MTAAPDVLAAIDCATHYVDTFVRRAERAYHRGLAKAGAKGEGFEPHPESVIAFERGTYVAEQVRLARATVAELFAERERMQRRIDALTYAAQYVVDNTPQYGTPGRGLLVEAMTTTNEGERNDG